IGVASISSASARFPPAERSRPPTTGSPATILCPGPTTASPIGRSPTLPRPISIRSRRLFAPPSPSSRRDPLESLPAAVTSLLFGHSSSASRGCSVFGACLRARIRSFLPALVGFAATPRDHIDEIIAAVIVGNLGACSDVLDGADDDLVAYRVDLGIGPARMIC